MDIACLVEHLKNCPISDVACKLDEFESENKNRFEFSGSDVDHESQLVDLLFELIHRQHEHSKTFSEITKASLACLKIISRCKDIVGILSRNNKYTLHLLSLADLGENISGSSNLRSDLQDSRLGNNKLEKKIELECLRILCNSLFHDVSIRKLCVEQRIGRQISMKLENLVISDSCNDETSFVQVKILFLISALEPQERPKMNDEYKTAETLVKILEKTLKENSLLDGAGSVSPEIENNEPLSSCRLSANDLRLISEILKTLFNISVCMSEKGGNQPSLDVYRKLTEVIHCILTNDEKLRNDLKELLPHVAHMLVNIPKSCLDGLIPGVKRRPFHEPIPKRDKYPVEYELKDMRAIITLLVALDNDLKVRQRPTESCSLTFSLLTSMCYVSRCLRLVRKYLRFQIMPPLREVKSRPEESSTLKGRLVKLMTDVDVNIKNLAADLLFVLCKENPDRLVKYTGYGNAAGLLASRGLMGGGRGAGMTAEYSSDEDDSDTEEYNAVADRVNPMTGAAYEQTEGDDPLEGMTEEEKQTNAEELMGLISKLSSLDVVKPMRIGADGRPREVNEEEAKEYFKKKIDEINKP